MAYPAGVSLCSLTTGSVTDFFGADASITATVTPVLKGTSHIVHAATGAVMVPAPQVFTADAGEGISFSVPHTDQDGWLDGAGNAYKGWYYKVALQIGSGRTSGPQWTKTVAPVLGQALVDLDLVAGEQIGVPVTAPVATVLSIAGLTGAVTEEQLQALGLGGASDGEIANLVQDEATATGAALVQTFALKSEAGASDAEVAAFVQNPDTATRAATVAVVESRAVPLVADPADTKATVTKRLDFRDGVAAKGSVLNLEHSGDGTGDASGQAYGLDIHNNPGAKSAVVIHQYSAAQAAVQIDNTDATSAIIIKNTNNPTRNPSGAAAGTSATGDFLKFIDTAGASFFRVLGRGEVIITPGADAAGHALEIVGNAASSKKLLRLIANGPQLAAEIIAQAGAAGFYPLTVSGYDYGGRFTTSQSGTGRSALRVEKNGTGAGETVTVINQGTGSTISLRTASATEVAKFHPNGEYELLTAGAGIIERAPDGTRYRLTPPNGGGPATWVAA